MWQEIWTVVATACFFPLWAAIVHPFLTLGIITAMSAGVGLIEIYRD